MYLEGSVARRGVSSDEPKLVWERPEPPGRPAPSPLSRDRIVRAAIELADADGLEGVSLRRVAAALDAGPMRLYGYLSTKDELLDLMVDAVYGEILPPEPTADWRAAVRAIAQRTRDAARRHEWFADLLGGRPHLGPRALAYQETVLAALAAAPGFEHIDTVARAAATLNAYLVGAIRKEVAEVRAERASGMDKRQWQIAAGPYLMRALASGAYPTLAAAIQNAGHPDADAVFAAGLEFVLDGIASRLAH